MPTSRTILFALVLGVVLTGCGQDETTPTTGSTTGQTNDQEPSMTAPDDAATSPQAAAHGLTLEATAQVGAPTLEGLDPTSRGLAVRYTVRNDGDTPVLVATDRGHSQHDRSRAPKNEESAWVALEGTTLVLSKELLPLPAGQVEEVETTLGAAVVPPGDSLEGTAFVMAPLRTDLPDTDAAPVHGAVDWRVCLTTAPATGSRSDAIGRLDEGQQQLCSEPAALPDGLP